MKKNKYNVLHIYKSTKFDSYGGVETFISLLTENFNFKNFNLSVLSCTKKTKKKFTYKKINFFLYKSNFELFSNTFSLGFFLNLFKHVRRSNIVHFHYPWPFFDLFYIFTCFLLNKKIIVTYHSDIVRQKYLYLLYFPIMLIFFKKVNFFVFTSKNYLESSKVVRFLIPKEKRKIIPLGIKCNPPINNQSLFKSLLIKYPFLKNKYFLFVGNHRFYKNIKLIIELAEHSDYNFVIVGDGTLFNHHLKLVKMKNLRNIFFIKKITDDNKFAIMANCLALLLLSNQRNEAFGYVILEAALCSIPSITLDINTGTTFANIHNKTGFSIRFDDKDLLNKLLKYCRILIEDEELKNKLGNGAYNNLLNNFDINSVASNYHKLYLETING